MNTVKNLLLLPVIAASFSIGCFSETEAAGAPEAQLTAASASCITPQASETKKEESNMSAQMVKITVNGHVLHMRLEDNPAAKAFVRKLPVTLPMSDLYGREMCFRFGAGALPTGRLRADRYEVGDVCYWPPRGSFVILYRQNGEEFERQQIGHIDSGVGIFEHTGDAKVTFELEK